MTHTKNLYSRLALITSVTLVVGYFVVYTAWSSLTVDEVGPGATITTGLMTKIKDNFDNISSRVTTLEGSIAGASVWSKVGNDINYTAGNVGIGTGSPGARLSVDTSAANVASFNSSSAGGGYTSYSKSGATYGFVGNADELTSVGGVGLALRSSGNMQIATGGSTTRMTIDSIGNVGIGFSGFSSALALYRNGSTPTLQLYSDRGTTSSSPAQLMQNSILFGGVNNQGWSTTVGAGIDFSINYPTDGTSGKLNFWTYPSTSASPNMTVYNGNVGIGTTIPGQRLDIVAGNGRVQSGYSWLTNSDVRYKEDIKTIDNSLNKILHLRGVYYKVKNGNGNENIGVMAQELEKEFPELVVTEANGYKSVKYSEIVAPLINAIKELKSQKDSEIEQLKKRIEFLENK